MQLRRVAPILLGAVSLALCGCATPKEYGASSEIQMLQSGELPVPSAARENPNNFDARISRYDTVIIDVMGFPELNDRKFVVDGSGDITVPIAGQVHVGGLNTAEAATAIASQMRAGHVRNPQVAVNLSELASNYVTVQGSVTMPGNYPVLDGMTLTRAIAAARGFNDYARTRDIVVLRKVDGQQYAALYDMGAIQRANYADPRVYPQDVVIVGESPQRRLLQQLLQGAPLLVGPIVALLQNS